jgi:chromate transporter
MAVTLFELALYFGVLSLISVGGMSSVLPEMQRMVVDVKNWVGATEFVQLYAIAQAAPGPNMLFAALVGWKVAGIAGALVALAAMCGPAGVLAWWVSGLWERFRESPWRAAIQRAITPLFVGLSLAGGYVLATPGGTPDLRLWGIAAASAVLALVVRLNPLWLIAAGGVAGAFFL